MILNLSSKNFKANPINENCGDFRKLNIIIGTNSSGKSSIFQPIILLKQTLQYGRYTNPILIDGPILRLGDFKDIKSDGNSKQITFCVGIKVPSDLFLQNSQFSFDDKKIDSIHLDITYKEDLNPESPKFGAELAKSKMTIIYRQEEGPLKLYQSLTKEKSAVEPGSWDALRGEKQQITGYKTQFSKHLAPQLHQDYPDAIVAGGVPYFFSPSGVYISYDMRKKRVQEIVRSVYSPKAGVRSGIKLDEHETSLIDAFLSKEIEINNLSHVNFGDKSSLIYPRSYSRLAARILREIAEINNPMDSLNPISSLRRSRTIREYAFRLEPIASDRLSKFLLENLEKKFKLTRVEFQEIEAAERTVRRYLEDRVNYIGPLRTPPQHIYSADFSPNAKFVGYSGEHTAAVFQESQREIISYHLPPTSTDSLLDLKTVTTGALHQACKEWLLYLGVIYDARVIRHKKIGIEFQVKQHQDDGWHHLTNVGVGVSQILPIVVGLLLSSRESVTIIEQPELHLHPLVQSRLGDFFLSQSKLGKQIIVESHSEYIVHRVRRRIAEGTNNIEKDVKLIYVERKYKKTIVSDIEISEYGKAMNWPNGFFDESTDEIEKTMMAAAKKRKSKQKNDDPSS